MQDIIEQLRHLQRTSRTLLIVQRLAVLLAGIGGAALLIGVIDFARPMPRAPRFIILILGIAAIIWLVITYIRRAAKFNPDLTVMALRVERQLPRVAGRLASAVEFATAGIDRTNPLAARAIRETERRLDGESVRQLVRRSRTINGVAILLAVAAIIATLCITVPASAKIGAARVFMPWTTLTWPARTGVKSLMSEVVSPANVYERGKALLLRAEVTRGDDQQRVDAMVRYQVDGRYQRWQQLVLTHQSSGQHERLIDTDATAVEIYFQTADAQTKPLRVELVPAPAIERATLVVTPPTYAENIVPAMTEELGQGIDDRSVASFASFIGSEAQLTLQLNKPIPAPNDSASTEDFLRTTFGWSLETLPEFTVDSSDQQRWHVSWRVMETTDLDLHLTDQYGLTNSEPITFRIAARSDRQPGVTITEPVSDQVVLPTAVVSLQASAEDDIALEYLSLTAKLRKAITDQSSETQPPVLIDEEIWSAKVTTTEAIAEISEQLDLSQMQLSVGDVVLITAYASDTFKLDGVRHDPAESAVRRLQVISELEYAEQIRRQLGGIRQNSIRIETLQAELQEDVIDEGIQPGIARAQAQIGQRLAEQRELIQQLADDLRRNQFDDEQLDTLLEQTGDLLDYAGRASTKAARQIEQQSQSANTPTDQANDSDPSSPQDNNKQTSPQTGKNQQQPSGQGEQQPSDTAQQPNNASASDSPNANTDQQPQTSKPAEEDQPIVDAQQEVRDELADLIELLDRDEDTWVITRRLENLLQQQQELSQATSELGEQTVGRSTDELTPAERTELERIVEQQNQLAEEARKLIDESRQRADALEDIDKQSAQGMRNAARTAEQRELDKDMQQASQRAEQNQLNSAQAAQQSASQTMQQMLEEIEQTKRAKAEQLLRQLASLVESIQRLVTVQENELIALAQAQANKQYDGRDRAMIRLNQNTISVEGEARAAGQPARRIARALDRAGDAQGVAIATLRTEPINHEKTVAAEERSLEVLKEAKTLAEELEQQVQEDETKRQREGLIEQYRALSEKQLVIRQDTTALVGIEELDRRQLVEARRLGNTQDQLRTALMDMQAATAELMEARVFAHVHKMLNQWSEQVSQSLWDSDVTVTVTDRQLRIAQSIGLLIDALNESMTPPDEFAEHQTESDSGGSGSGGQSPLIPPIAELKLVRGLQEQIYDQTKDIEAHDQLDEAARRTRLRELGRMQRELLELGTELINDLTTPSAPQPLPGPDADLPRDTQQ